MTTPAVYHQDERLYEGKAKIVYRTSDPGVFLVYYKDDATAFNGLKKGQIREKGVYNNLISARFFRILEEEGVPTHFLEQVDDRTMAVKALTMLPVEVVVRNIAAGSLAKRLGWDEGRRMPFPVREFYYKNDDLGDPLLNEDHLRAMGLATPDQVRRVGELALQINQILADFLEPRGIVLVDFKLEFGVTAEGQVVVGDEISPDTCRFWDASSGKKLDKDRFRRDLGRVEEAYHEVWERIKDEISRG